MSRFIKEKMVEQYGERFRDVAALAVVNVQGVDVIRMTAFRRTLRGRGIHSMRIHNRLGRRALAAGNLAGIETLLAGPSTLVWGGDSIVDIAKVLRDEAATLAELEIRGGMSDGDVLSAAQLKALSDLPSREELIGMAVGKAVGQAARVVAAAMSAGSHLLGQIREIEEQAPPADEPPAQEDARADAAEQKEAPAGESAAAEEAADETPKDETQAEPKPDETQDTGGAEAPTAPDEAPADP